MSKTKKVTRKASSLLLALVLAMSMLTLSASGAEPVTLAAWTLTGALAASPGTPATGGVMQSKSYLSATSTYSGYTAGNNTVYYNNWSVGGYWEIRTSAAGYENLVLKFSSYGSNTGPKNFAAYISSDGTAFNKVSGSDYTLSATATSGDTQNITVNLPKAAEDVETLTIRLTIENNVSINDGTLAGTGTSRIGNVSLTGETADAKSLFERYTGDTIEPGKYVVTAGNASNTWAWRNTMNTSGNNMLTLVLGAPNYDISLVTGLTELTDLIDCIWEIDVDAGFYTLKTTNLESNRYAYAAGGTGANNYLRLIDAVSTDTHRWKITKDTGADTYKVVCADTTTARNTLSCNNTNVPPLFSCYASGQLPDLTLWKYNDNGEPPVEPPGPEIISIAQANATAAAPGAIVTIKGQATYRYADTTITVQDGTGENDGICLYMGGANFSSYVGKVIQVTGVRTDYRGLKELVPASLSDVIVTSDPVFINAPKEITLAELAAGKYVGSWIAVKDVQLTYRNPATTAQNHTITQGGVSVTLRAALSNAIAQGDWLTIAGCGYMFDSAQLFTWESDIVPGTEPPPKVVVPTDGEGSIAEWISPTVTDVIGATGGDYKDISTFKIVGTTSTTLNWANSAINRAGGFDNKADTAYWLAELSSEGFANLEVSWSIRSSGTGPRDFKLQYSADGLQWHDADDAAFVVGNALGIGVPASQFSSTLPEGANDNETLYIRWLQTSNYSANGGTVASAGTNSINNIVITGGYIIGDNQLRRPVATPESGAVPLGQVIAFTPNPEDAGVAGYAVMVSIDDGLTWNQATGNSFTPAALPATILVKAVAPGMMDSSVATYSYTHAKLPMVTPSRNSGPVIPGATIRLENSVPGATIKYKINGGGEITYDQALTLEETLFVGDPATLTIETWAQMDGYISGDATTLYYTIAVSGGERVYFGQIHSHTTLSDGAGEVEDAFAYARDVAGLDFFAVTDHSNTFDETGTNGDNPAVIDLDTYNANSAKWQRGQNAAINARRADFISFYGYEMTWSGGPGHINTFNTGGFASRNNTMLNSKVNDAGMRAYYELLTRHPNSISMFNHPGTTFGNFSNFGYYDPVIDQRMTLLEVGNGEGAIGSGGYFPSYEQYTLALDKGWHVAPANDQDNHLGKWGNSNTARTAIWTNDLSLGGVYQALKDMRVYATEVDDLEIVYKVNGQPLGSILDVVPPTANFTAEIDNPTAANIIKSVCLVTNGGVEIYKVTPASQNFYYNITITNPSAGYYYLRVIVSTPQGDRIAVTAPVWLGQSKSVGFVEVTKSAIMPVTGEPMDIKASLFNNESNAVTLMSLKYTSKNGTVLGDFSALNTTIPASGETSHSFVFTPLLAGPETITAEAVVKFADDSEMVYTYDLSFEVWDADKLVFIGVDAYHYNEYVDGNYKDNMANFAAIAADYGVRVNILWTSAELIAAASNPKYQALILTAPSRRVDPSAMNPSTGQLYGPHRSYSQTELDAIAGFSEAGGTTVLTGWSNIYESYSYTNTMPLDAHMASQQNKVLAAVGSTLRLSDDAASDPLQWSSSSDPYRLYMTDAHGSYNWSNPLLAGAVSNQIFSQYGGSTIYTVDPANSGAWNAVPSVTVPASVTPAIMMSPQGRSENRESTPPGTNYRTDYTKNNDRFMLMASEVITYTDGTEAMVIAAGGAFMSNFEVKIEMENSATLQYSNYNIALNLIKSIAPQPDILDIADVKELPEGTQVTIEGIATSNVHNGVDTTINTGFFDCIYAQDGTGGINLFPIASGVAEGQKIRVTGTVGAYQGEIQIQVSKYEVIDATINKVTPVVLTTEGAMAPDNTGLLVNVTGVVSDVRMDGAAVTQFIVTDVSGVGALVYINAYITSGVDLSFVEEGATVSVTGLASIGENVSGSPLPRIRVRDRNEITLISSPAALWLASGQFATITVRRGNTTTIRVETSGDPANLVYTSAVPVFATVSQSGVVTGVMPGITVIRIVDSVTGASLNVAVNVII